MAKISKNFHYHYPLKHKVVRDLRIVTEHIGDLEVEGIAYHDPSMISLNIADCFAIDIEAVRWDGTDIKQVLSFCGLLDDIQADAVRHVASELFHPKTKEAI